MLHTNLHEKIHLTRNPKGIHRINLIVDSIYQESTYGIGAIFAPVNDKDICFCIEKGPNVRMGQLHKPL